MPQGAVLVLGMHRSGTSALARGLQTLGLELGKNLKPGIAGENDKGFFEDWTLSNINDELLGLLGCRWDSLVQDPLARADPAQMNELKLRAINAIDAGFGQSPYFVFKDPRSCRVVPFWKDIMARQGLRAVYVIAFRNPMSVAKSLEAREGFARIRSYYLWLLHVLDAIRQTVDDERIFIEYDDLMRDPHGALERIAGLVSDPTVRVDAESMRVYARDFLDPSLRHHICKPSHLALDSSCPSLVREVYQALRREVGPADDRIGADEWARLVTAFDAGSEFSGLLELLDRELRSAQAELVAKSEQLSSLADTLAKERQGATARAAQIDEEYAKALLQTQEKAIERVATLEASLTETRTESAREREVLVAVHGETLAALKRAHAATLESLASNVCLLTDRFQETERRAEVLANEVRQLAERLAASKEELRARERDALDFNERLAATASALADRDAVIGKLQEQLAALDFTHAEQLCVANEALMSERREAAQHLKWAEQRHALELQGMAAELASCEATLRQVRIDALELEAAYQEKAGALESAALDQMALKRRVADGVHAYAAEMERAYSERMRALEHAIHLISQQLLLVYASSSWRLTAPFRALKLLLTGGRLSEAVPATPPAHAVFAPTAVNLEGLLQPSDAVPEKGVSVAFFTICSRNFLAFARVLHESLRTYHPDSQFFVALCDLPEPPFNAADEPFSFVYLDDLDLPEWREMAQRYNITEFNTAIKPFVIQHLMNREVADYIVYMDPDTIVTSRMEELLTVIAGGASAVLTPHITQPAERAEVHDGKMLLFGVYNLGFAAFRRSPEVLAVIAWWGRRLIRECVIKLEEGLFVDQKWADLFPAFLSDIHVLRHPGYNVAYWNVSQRSVTYANGAYRVNGEPMRFAHFSGNKLDDPEVFSRHSGQFTVDNIGDLARLLDEYRRLVFAHGHERYKCIPYAFSWDGVAGVNLHTPRPENQVVPAGNAEADVSLIPNGVAHAGMYQVVQTAAQMAGGLPQLAVKAARALRTGGVEALKERLQIVQRVADEAASLRAQSPAGGGGRGHERLGDLDPMPWRKKVFFTDWSTPRPDRDAGSLTSFRLMELLTHLGFDVTFIPSDLEYLGTYTEVLRATGVKCLHREEVGSIGAHLQAHGDQYDFVLVCRAPIAELYVDDIRRHARRAKIILNTSDLHFLRNMREAELTGDAERIKAATAAKLWELGVIRRCDVTIILSSIERDLLAAELPDADVRWMPLIFADLSENRRPFRGRSGLLFIGSFPHLPNADAAVYFGREIFPLIQSKLPDVVWHVVGSSPPPEVLAMEANPSIKVHGHVKDIGPLFQAVKLSVAPLRYGAGIKGKLGTSMSFGVPSVATSIAVEGMQVIDGRDIRVADEPKAFADAVVELYQDEVAWDRMSIAGRSTVLQHYSVPAGQRRMRALMRGFAPSEPRLEMHAVSSYGSYVELREFLADELKQRQNEELALVRRDAQSFLTPGFCSVCGCESTFNTSFMYSYEITDDGQPIPNWREHLDCTTCRFQNRLRASLHLFYALMRPKVDSKIYLTEQATPLYRWLSQRHPGLVGSEFLGTKFELGAMVNGLRNEDLTRLTFDEGSFDYVMSFDVLEHVADDIAAISEVFRCLKPGGRFFFSAPFAKDEQRKVVRAQLHANGIVEHFMPPEYHGNPVDQENGALCFRYFAWDLLDDLRRQGFENCRAMHYWSRDFAYFGGEQFLFIADKPIRANLPGE